MKQLIEEQRKEFEERFGEDTDQLVSAHNGWIQKEIWNWHKQSLKQFIDELIVREEGDTREFKVTGDGEYHFGENQKVIGWNMAKEYTIAHLKKLKEELN